MGNRVLKASFLAFGAMGVLGATSLIDTHDAFAQASATNGQLRGQIKDKATGEAAIGATVVATSPALVGEQVVITDETGQYFVNSLPPGLYTLTIYYENKTFSRANVLIQLGKEALVNVTVDPKAEGKAVGSGKGEVIEVSGTVPIIDQGSTKTGVTITDDYTRNIPTGRTFGGVLGASAGTAGDTYGTSISGATSAENIYVVEGINTTDTGFGGLSTNLPNEFIQETEVITGGYNAEFGRATGGIVNVVTKQGSNQFRGSVFGYFTPGALVADAEGIQREGSAVDSETNLDYRYDFGAELGGPIIKDKLWFHVGLNPSFSKTTVRRTVNTQVDDNADGIPDIDPDTGFTIHKEVGAQDLVDKPAQYFFTAKINGAVNQNNQFQISAFGNPETSDPVFALTRNPETTQYHSSDGAYDLSGKWTSKFNEGKTQVDAVVGFHRGYENQQVQAGREAIQDVPRIRFNQERSLYDFQAIEGGDAVVGACNDTDPATDPYPMIRNCPVIQYSSQGLGFLEERTNDRTSAILSVTQRVKAAGYHTFKVGGDVELATYDSGRINTGGSQIFKRQNDSATGPGNWQLRQFMKVARNLNEGEIMDPTTIPELDPANPNFDPNAQLCAGDRALCVVADKLQADTNNTSLAAYVQDSWQVLPNLTFNLGLRWEQQTGYVAKALQGTLTPEGETVPDAAYKLNNLVAPRVGFIYDPTKEGKAKVFGHWGRFYESVPMDLNVRAFGGEITNFTIVNASRLSAGDPGYDPNCDVDFTNRPVGTDLGSIILQCQDRAPQALLGQGLEFVTDLKGQYTQEVIAGAEYEFMPDLKVAINYIHRTLPTVIEDISTDGGNTYLITNPGEDLSGQAADLHKQAEELMNSGDPEKMALGEVLESRSKSVAFVSKYDKPTRNYDAVQLQATQRPTRNSLLIASYTYSAEKGNYPGLFSTETGQLDPNLTSLYDLPDLMANRYGPLGLDRPHNFKVDGFYRFNFKQAGLLTTGGSFRLLSGIAHNALAAHPTYGNGESYLLPRGSFERSPVTTSLDAHVSYGYQINKTTMFEGFVRIFNVLNTQDELNVDEIYTFDNANPVVGGTPEDLAHIKALDDFGLQSAGATTVTPNKNFGHLNSRQAPRSIQLGVRLTF